MYVISRLVLPLMQSYTQAGEFTVKGKLKSALLDNAIYYGSYLFICGILLAYIAVKPDLQLDNWYYLFNFFFNFKQYCNKNQTIIHFSTIYTIHYSFTLLFIIFHNPGKRSKALQPQLQIHGDFFSLCLCWDMDSWLCHVPYGFLRVSNIP